MTGNVSWAELTFIVGMLGAVIMLVAGGVGGALMWLWAKHNKFFKAITDIKLEFKEELSTVRLTMAQEYVTMKALDRVTDQMNQAIDRLGARLETALRAIGVPISPRE
jgi:hypothetical protein